MTAIVIGIGEDAAGDDGVGRRVARRLADSGLEIRESADPSILLPLLEAGRQIVVIDAVVGGEPPGTVLQLAPGTLTNRPGRLSHGLGVAETIALARTLYGDTAIARVAIVGVAIEPPTTGALELSPAVAAAIDEAASLARSLAGA